MVVYIAHCTSTTQSKEISVYYKTLLPVKSICFSFFWKRPLSLSLERPFALISCACHSFVVVGVDDALQLPLSIRERTVHSVRKICDLLVFRDVQ